MYIYIYIYIHTYVHTYIHTYMYIYIRILHMSYKNVPVEIQCLSKITIKIYVIITYDYCLVVCCSPY